MKKIKILAISLIAFTTLNSCSKSECEYTNNEDQTFPYSCNNGMDVAFVIDYTGSMGSAIDGIKTSVGSIVSTIVTESSGDYRLSLSIFDENLKTGTFFPAYLTSADYTGLPAANKKIITTGANTDQYLTMMEKFSAANSTTFGTQLAKLNGSMSLGYGIGGPEPGGFLINEIINNAFAGTWRSGVTKLMIIITDAQDGGDDDTNTILDDTYLSALATQANADGIQCLLVTTLPSSNYEVSLINNNTTGVALVKPDFSNISTDIITLIENICTENDQ